MHMQPHQFQIRLSLDHRHHTVYDLAVSFYAETRHKSGTDVRIDAQSHLQFLVRIPLGQFYHAQSLSLIVDVRDTTIQDMLLHHLTLAWAVVDDLIVLIANLLSHIQLHITHHLGISALTLHQFADVWRIVGLVRIS